MAISPGTSPALFPKSDSSNLGGLKNGSSWLFSGPQNGAVSTTPNSIFGNASNNSIFPQNTPTPFNQGSNTSSNNLFGSMNNNQGGTSMSNIFNQVNHQQNQTSSLFGSSAYPG